MVSMMVRYTVKPDRVAENERYVEGVYAELARNEPAGMRYATFRLDDGRTVVHLFIQNSDEGRDVLPALPAFQAFRAGLEERCETPPVRTPLREVGSYRFAGE